MRGAEGVCGGLVLSCEHGGNRIPAEYQGLFEGQAALLDSHRGYDPGALRMAQAFAEAFAAPLVSAEVSRLLVDLNRSIGHPHLHLAPVRDLPAAQRRQLLERYYTPYRSEVAARVDGAIARQGCAIHLSSHSFTPVLDGQVRRADVGLLYDPARPAERALCARWLAALRARAPVLVVRRNYPYRGNGDGLTTWLRRRLPADRYLGIELELNQRSVSAPDAQWAELRAVMVASFAQALHDLQSSAAQV